MEIHLTETRNSLSSLGNPPPLEVQDYTVQSTRARELLPARRRDARREGKLRAWWKQFSRVLARSARFAISNKGKRLLVVYEVPTSRYLLSRRVIEDIVKRVSLLTVYSLSSESNFLSKQWFT